MYSQLERRYAQRIRDLLWNCDSLLKDNYLEDKNKSFDIHPLYGHCYVASEAFYHATGGSDSPFKPMHIHHEGNSHWFLKNRHTGDIVDLTEAQFSTPVPHDKATGRGFMTKHPSKRAKVVLEALGL